MTIEPTGYHVVAGVSITIKKSDPRRSTESDQTDVSVLDIY